MTRPESLKIHLKIRAQIADAPTRAEAKRLAVRACITQAEAGRIYDLHFARKCERAALGHCNGIANRVPGGFASNWESRQIADAYDRAGYRTATHSHALSIKIGVPSGASSDSGTARPSSVGLPNAYTGFHVATSAHTLRVAPHWLRNVKGRGLGTVDGLLTLECAAEPDQSVSHYAYPAVWVRQGRGTSLVTERGWLVQRADGYWTHANTVRAAKLARQPLAAVLAALDVSTEQALELDPIVTLAHCRAAGLCQAGCSDFIERHLGGSRRGIRARVLHRVAVAAGDRVAFVERAIRHAAGLAIAKQQARAA
jgi:hypothetical protein